MYVCTAKATGVGVMQATGFGYEHDDCWSKNLDLFREFTDVTQGVRRLGAAAVDMCHVAIGLLPSLNPIRVLAGLGFQVPSLSSIRVSGFMCHVAIGLSPSLSPVMVSFVTWP
jgi:hypothetical protein